LKQEQPATRRERPGPGGVYRIWWMQTLGFVLLLQLVLCCARSAQLSRYSLTAREAICNDGTAGAYYYSRTDVEAGKDLFLLWLPGGGQCFDISSCQSRWEGNRALMTSTGAPTQIFLSGIFDTDPKLSPLWAANKAVLLYCSSDAFMGNGNFGSWTFRGSNLVYDFIRVMRSRHNLSSRSTVIFGGASAGARGAMVLVDELVRDHFPTKRVLALLDSPYWIDKRPLFPAGDFQGFLNEVLSLMNAGSYTETGPNAWLVNTACHLFQRRTC